MRKTTLLIAALMIAAVSFAQETLSEFAAWQPKYIQEANGAPKGIQQGQTWQQWCEAKIKNNDLGETTKTAWVVYSDRENNPTYQSPSYNAPKGKPVKFGEKLYVAKVQNGFALVFSSNKTIRYPKIKGADFRGWMPIENLLLWQVCPKSKNQIYQKALVVFDPTQTEGGTPIDKDPKFLFAPDKDAPVSAADAKTLDILFIMKTVIVDGKAFYLLSNQANCSDIGTALYGWLPSTYITPWDQRLALEPQYNSSKVRAYTSRDLKPAAYSRFEEAERYYNKGIMGRPLYQYKNFSTKRMDALIMRQPIIDSTPNPFIYKVAVTASLNENGEVNTKGGGAQYEQDKAATQRKINELTKKQQNINIIFVMDATKSMKDFYTPITNALKEISSYEFFDNPSTASRIKIGAVLYKADFKSDPEFSPLNHDLSKVISFLGSVKPSADGNDHRVALIKGLQTALDCKKMGYQPGQSNYIILLGDAADRHKDNSGKDWLAACDEVAGKMKENSINFLAYQVYNGGLSAYEDYSMMVGQIQETLRDLYSAETQNAYKYKRTGPNILKLVRKETEEDIPLYCWQKYAKNNTMLDANEVTLDMVQHVEKFYDMISKRIVKYNRLSDGGYRINNDSEEEAIREELRLAWGKDQEKKIEATINFMKRGGVAKFETYAPVMTKSVKEDLGYSVYQTVLFFSQDELQQLILNLRKFTEDRGDQHKAYQNALLTMGSAMLGEFSTSRISNMDINEMMGQIYGVPVKLTVSETGFRISDIPNLSDEEVKTYMRQFRQKLEALEDLIGGNDNGRFERNGNVYYWIPTDMMPGFKLELY